MILEIALLDVISVETLEFEAAFKEAQKIISNMPGYLEHDLQKCLEKENRYALLIKWNTLEDHTIGFRQSPQYQQWKELLHHFYDPFTQVEHYKKYFSNAEKLN